MPSELDRQRTAVLPEAVKIALNKCAAELTGALVLCGFPASGKSTAATYVAGLVGATVLDKDGLAPGLEQAVMRELTGDPYDRDSDTYKAVVGPHIYDSLIRTGMIVAARHPVVLDAPFLEAIRQAAPQRMPLAEHLRTRSGLTTAVPLTTVWLNTPTPQIRTRMISRGAERDDPKLADWAAYESGVLDSGIRELAHAVVDIVIDN
ncbi:ATP-binding protein [Nocardia sp. NBC_01730]|uniref:AAA family ATPase n=1 Tax=Nocardia sp. NBC_01730 TaxID=2975998 RepID=UPI002E16377A|nr:ATP-binding protein [Nocardia sp. NBC_01730]